MPILGAHQSIAGGFYKAVERAAEIGCDCVQLFTANTRSWPKALAPPAIAKASAKKNPDLRPKTVSTEDVDKFQSALKRLKVKHPVAHDSYLINLAAPDETLWRKSLEAFTIELLRADSLGIPYVVTHPGACLHTSEQTGIQRIVAAINEVHDKVGKLKTRTLLENTAGQGSALGWKFEHLAAILDAVDSPDRLAVCIDTCHLFAAGYSLSTPEDYKATMKQLDKTVGLKLVKAIHLNDSKKDFGSRVDRHEHIGRGKLGLQAFRLLINDPRFQKVPMYLETPKEDEDGTPNGAKLDKMNLATLRGLIEA